MQPRVITVSVGIPTAQGHDRQKQGLVCFKDVMNMAMKGGRVALGHELLSYKPIVGETYTFFVFMIHMLEYSTI